MHLRSPLLDTGRDVFIVGAVRTPIGRGHPEKGWFAAVHPNSLLESCYRSVLERTGCEPRTVEDLIVGTTSPIGAQSRNIARNAWLQGGYPVEVPGATIDRRCGSAQSAITMGVGLVASGTHEVVIAGGVEHMGRVPIDAMRTTESQFGDPWPEQLRSRFDFVHQGESAERIAEQWAISREAMDEYAVRSHRSAAAAAREGRFHDEIVQVPTKDTVIDRDQGIRPDTTVQALAALATPFRDNGRLTAGTSSQISDGAAVVLLASRAACEKYGLQPRARVIDQTTVGVDPIIMLTGPIPATNMLLQRTGLTISDLDLIEVNEAFASVVLAWRQETGADMARVNVNGGAIALGHPVGATGARLFTTLLHELERRDASLGLVTMCCGGGLGTGAIIERVDGRGRRWR